MSGNNGWHGDAAKQGWFGDREYEVDPRTINRPQAARGWSRKTSAKDNLKKWAKGKTKEEVKAAKKKIKKFRKDHETQRARAKRLEHNHELRRTRPERMQKAARDKELNQELKRRREFERENKQYQEGKRSHIMDCHWCHKPFDLQTWKHVDGQPCPGPHG